jgi:hypothetical protein
MGSLVDGGSNGGLAGADVTIVESYLIRNHGRNVDIVGVGGNIIKEVPLCTEYGLVQTHSGPIIAVMHNYAALKTGNMIHSALQLKDYGIEVDDTPKSQKRFGGEPGTQMIRITTYDKIFEIPLDLIGGLSHFKMSPVTMETFKDRNIPQVVLTSATRWDPSKYDNDSTNNDGDPSTTEEQLIDNIMKMMIPAGLKKTISPKVT